MLEWIKENAAFLTLVVTIVGGGVGGTIALLQWGKQICIRRTEFVYQVMQDLRANPDMMEVTHKIAYGELRDDDLCSNRSLEIKTDRLLGVLNYHCYLLKRGAITKKDFGIFESQIIWTLSDPIIQTYVKRQTSALRYLIDWGLHNGSLSYDLTQQKEHP